MQPWGTDRDCVRHAPDSGGVGLPAGRDTALERGLVTAARFAPDSPDHFLSVKLRGAIQMHAVTATTAHGPASVVADASNVLSSEGTRIPIRDSATRLFLLGQLVSHIESSDQSNIAQLIAAGIPSETLESLRNLTLADTVRFASGYLGISISIDCRALVQQLQRIDRARDDRSLYESFVRRGASPRLVARLFGMSEVDVRRLRKLVAPAACTGGRPRRADDDTRGAIQALWALLVQAQELAERDRWWQLANRFEDLPIVALECALEEFGQR